LEETDIYACRNALLDPELIKTVCAAPYVERAASKYDWYN